MGHRAKSGVTAMISGFSFNMWFSSVPGDEQTLLSGVRLTAARRGVIALLLHDRMCPLCIGLLQLAVHIGCYTNRMEQLEFDSAPF